MEWRQVGEYAAVTDFVWLRRMKLVLDDAEGGPRHVPMSPGVKTSHNTLH